MTQPRSRLIAFLALLTATGIIAAMYRFTLWPGYRDCVPEVFATQTKASARRNLYTVGFTSTVCCLFFRWG